MNDFRMGVARAIAVAIAVALSACATSDRPPSHPNYAAAIADLRIARTILDREPEYAVARSQYRAIEAIDRAVLELKDAAIEGGQPLGAAPTLDPTLDYGARLSRARELIVGADHELNFKEDDSHARPSRDNARHYVEEAREAVDRTIRERQG